MAEQKKIDALYRVYTVHSNLKHGGRIYDGVRVTWFCVSRENPLPIPLRRAIRGVPTKQAELAVNELFTWEEAHALRVRLLQMGESECRQEPIHLPISNDSTGISGTPVGGLIGRITLQLDLPFSVAGYYDLRNEGVTFASSRPDEGESKSSPRA